MPEAMDATPNDAIFAYLLDYAYEPLYVYGGVVVLLTASSFGLPFPEEATLLSAGLLAHIGSRPDLYPPPSPDAQGVGIGTMAVVCFLSVVLSDLLVFSLGRLFGPRILKSRLMARMIKPEAWARIETWTRRYGAWACGIFRFTPGLRFPGHFTCGSLGISYWTFLAVDGAAALVSVPTQVILMGFWGQEVLAVLKDVKLVIFGIFAAAVVVLLFRRWRARPAASTGVLTSAKSTRGEPDEPRGVA
jgi:membrane protein DedA with SNARE-associated domain